MSKIKIGDLVYFEWQDHFHEYTMGWREQSDIDDKPMINRTVGWVVKLSPTMISTASTIEGETGKFSGGYGCKLRKCITKIKILKRK